MSTNQAKDRDLIETKKFGKTEREVPHHSIRAKKYYPATDERLPKKVSPYFDIGALTILSPPRV
jgi:hypothetical protein